MMKRDLSISLFLPTLAGGGAERVMVRRSRAFAERGIDVEMVLANATGDYLPELPSTVKVVNLGASRVLFSIPRLALYLRRVRPAILLSTLRHANCAALIARKLARTSTRIFVREAITPLSQARQMSILTAPLLLTSIRLYREAEAIIVNSQYVANELREILKSQIPKVYVISNPVVEENLLRHAQQPVDHPWFTDQTAPVVVSVGRLTAQKDFETLVRAIPLVHRYKDCRLVILGEGEQRAHIESLIVQLGLQDKVWMPGFDPNPFRYMARASVFVLSSRWEGSPNALIEALACGAPAVATDCPGGSREILEDGKWGKLVPVGNPEALAEAIVYTLKTPPDVRQLQHRARAFSVDLAAEHYLRAMGIL